MLEMFVVYKNPRDFPNKFVVRRWVGTTPDPACSVHDTLGEARAAVPPGSACISRQPDDDSVILEMWL